MDPEAATSPSYVPRWRAERLIASSRVVLATLSLLALWLDPNQPSRDSGLTYWLLGCYAVYSVAIGVVAWSVRSPARAMGIATHVVDLAVFTLLIYLTNGPTSPFFLYFMFAMVAASMRWQSRGAFWTAIVLLAAFAAMVGYASVRHDQTVELTRAVMRATHLVIMAILLGYLSAHHALWRRDWIALANWNAPPPQTRADLLQTALGRSASVLEAQRAILVWEEDDEPWLFLATWTRDGFRTWREEPVTYESLTASNLTDAVFGSPDVGRASRAGLLVLGNGAPDTTDSIIDANFAAQFQVRSVLSAPVRSDRLQGRLFLLDCPSVTDDALVLTALVAGQLTMVMNHYVLLRTGKRAAVMSERRQIAREMHDGPLQALGGVAMQLETVAVMAAEQCSPVVQERLHGIQQLIVDEQRDLRLVLGDLRYTSAGMADTVEMTLRELAGRFQDIWNIKVTVTTGTAHVTVNPYLAHEIRRLVREALVNVARHSGASHAKVDFCSRLHELCITVTDDGHGFSFKGRHDHESLTALRIGPVCLKERVESLEGSLSINSTPTGSTLAIVLPSHVAEWT